jgi:hypothetical protein
LSAIPWRTSAASKPASALPHVGWDRERFVVLDESFSGLSTGVSGFFVNTQDGRVATRRQLVEAGNADADENPEAPWHAVQGPRDASTMWYAVLRKRERGVFIGTLCIRHTGRQASLEQAGWEEVPVGSIRP